MTAECTDSRNAYDLHAGRRSDVGLSDSERLAVYDSPKRVEKPGNTSALPIVLATVGIQQLIRSLMIAVISRELTPKRLYACDDSRKDFFFE